jgi:hypothetical protein
MQRYFTYFIVAVLAAFFIYSGLEDLFGEWVLRLSLQIIAGALGIGAALWLIVSVWAGPIGFIKRQYTKHLSERAAVKLEQAKALKLYAEAKNISDKSRYSVSTGPHVVLVDHHNGVCRQYIAPSKSVLMQPEEQEPQYTAIDIIKKIAAKMQGKKDAPCLVFAGPKRAGKSFTAKICTEIIPAVYYALDPKEEDAEDIYADHVKVVGRNDNWREIIDLFEWIINTEQPKRALLKKTDLPAFKKLPKIIIILEELLTTLEGDPNIATYYIMVLTKFSEFGIGLIVVTHATTATAMGFKPGQSELKRCFDAVFRFDYDVLSEKREYFVTLRGKEEMELLPYDASTVTGVTSRHENFENHSKSAFSGDCDTRDGVTIHKLGYAPNSAVGPVKQRVTRYYESKIDKKICEAYDDGKSLSAICTCVGWSKNGRNTNKAKAILKKYGVDTGV